MSTIKIIDQTLRDGQQSHWGIKMRAKHILPVAADLDQAGFHVVDVTGSSVFVVAIRQFRENPWEALDHVARAMPNSLLRAGVRPNAIVGFALTPTVLVDLWTRTLIRHGVRSHWIFDCLFGMEGMRRACAVVADEGGEVVPTLMYSLSEVHTDEFFAAKAREIASWGIADTLQIEDASGVLTPERARTLLAAIRGAAPGLPIELHCHNLTGLAPLNYIEGLAQDVTILHTSTRCLANGASLPSTEQTVDNLRRLGHQVDVDLGRVAVVDAHFRRVAEREGYELGVPHEYSVRNYEHQIPGGMMGTLKSQLAQHGISDRLDDLLEEVSVVRRELGLPVMATPFSQLVGIQALLNLVGPERYAMVSDEVVTYLLGRMGEIPGPVDQKVLDRVMSTPRAREIQQIPVEEPTLEEIRRRFGAHLTDEQLLLRALLPESEINAMEAAGPIDLQDSEIRTPALAEIVRALREVGPSTKHVRLDRLGYRASLTR